MANADEKNEQKNYARLKNLFVKVTGWLGPQRSKSLKESFSNQTSAPNAVLNYFENLSENYTSQEEFEGQWIKIPDQDFNTQDLSNLMYGTSIAISRWKNDREKNEMRNYVRKNLKVWYEPLHKNLTNLDSHELIKTVSSLTRAGAVVPGRLLANTLKDVDHNFEGIEDKDISIFISSAAQSKTHIPKSIVEKIERKTLRHPGTFDHNAELAKLRHAAILRIDHSPEYIKFISDNLLDRLQNPIYRFTQQRVVNGYWACAILNALGHDLSVLGNALHEKANRYEITHSSELRQHYHASLWFDLPTNQKPTPQQDRQSATERKFIKAFKAEGFNVEHKYQSQFQRINHVFDFTLNMKKNGKIKNIFFEVDGYFNALKRLNPRTRMYKNIGYDGTTLFKSALMKKLNGDNTIVHINGELVSNILNLSDTERRKAFTKLAHASFDLNNGPFTKNTGGIFFAQMNENQEFEFENLQNRLLKWPTITSAQENGRQGYGHGNVALPGLH